MRGKLHLVNFNGLRPFLLICLARNSVLMTLSPFFLMSCIHCWHTLQCVCYLLNYFIKTVCYSAFFFVL
jgi:hypothetical protein